MTGALDAYPFVLAERLGMTLRELEERMTIDELYQWAAYDTWRAEMQKMNSGKR